MKRVALGACAGFITAYTAVRAYEAWSDLRQPRGPLEKNAREYGATKRALMVAGFARSLAGHALAAWTIAPHVPRRLRAAGAPLVTAAYVAAGTLLDAALELPVDYVEGHLIERRYGLSSQTLADWLRDRAKSTAVSVAIGTTLVAGLLTLARRFPRTWPLFATLAAPPVLFLLTMVAPAFIAPLFNRFEPLQGPMERRLRALATRYGVGDADIVRFDMSRQTNKANAYVAGLLGTHRIALADTLLDGFTEDEVEFVVAHELGHYVAGDTWIGVAAGSAAIALLILGAAALTGDEPVTTIPGFARFNFAMQLLTAAIVPIVAAGSRLIERRADRFALAATRRADWGIAAFERLRERNLAEDEQPRWAELLVATHPSLRSRIERLREAASQSSSEISLQMPSTIPSHS